MLPALNAKWLKLKEERTATHTTLGRWKCVCHDKCWRFWDLEYCRLFSFSKKFCHSHLFRLMRLGTSRIVLSNSFVCRDFFLQNVKIYAIEYSTEKYLSIISLSNLFSFRKRFSLSRDPQIKCVSRSKDRIFLFDDLFKTSIYGKRPRPFC